MAKKNVYFFGGGKADGNAEMKNLLGGKGANLAEMCNLGIPVPAGFTITTEMCTEYYENNKKLPAELTKEVNAAMAKVEKVMGKKFGDPKNPLLVSVRSGARRSMPGMMDTVLNVGLTIEDDPGPDREDEQRALRLRRLPPPDHDVRRRGHGEGRGHRAGRRRGRPHAARTRHGARQEGQRRYELDTDLTAEDLKALCEEFKAIVKKVIGKAFPDDAQEQLWGGIKAVFQSWNGKRAIEYRRIERIPDEWGTAVNVQAMVFGNMGDNSATGVAFTRDPATGENKFYGEWLVNAQGEDVVAGIRTPSPAEQGHQDRAEQAPASRSKRRARSSTSSSTTSARSSRSTTTTCWTSSSPSKKASCGCCSAASASARARRRVRMAVDMAEEKLIDKKTAIMRVAPEQLDELLHPMIDPEGREDRADARARVCRRVPAAAWARSCSPPTTRRNGRRRARRSSWSATRPRPEDVHGMHVAEAILTAKGGMTSPRGARRARLGQVLHRRLRRAAHRREARRPSPSAARSSRKATGSR